MIDSAKSAGCINAMHFVNKSIIQRCSVNFAEEWAFVRNSWPEMEIQHFPKRDWSRFHRRKVPEVPHQALPLNISDLRVMQVSTIHKGS